MKSACLFSFLSCWVHYTITSISFRKMVEILSNTWIGLGAWYKATTFEYEVVVNTT